MTQLDVSAVNIDQWYVINTELLTEIYNRLPDYS